MQSARRPLSLSAAIVVGGQRPSHRQLRPHNNDMDLVPLVLPPAVDFSATHLAVTPTSHHHGVQGGGGILQAPIVADNQLPFAAHHQVSRISPAAIRGASQNWDQITRQAKWTLFSVFPPQLFAPLSHLFHRTDVQPHAENELALSSIFEISKNSSRPCTNGAYAST